MCIQSFLRLEVKIKSNAKKQGSKAEKGRRLLFNETAIENKSGSDQISTIQLRIRDSAKSVAWVQY